MDIIAYQKQRDSDLAEFEQQYSILKQKYTETLSQASHEQDIEKQAELIKNVLEINSNLAADVRAFISKTHTDYDPKSVQHLTDDLVKYQEEYLKIQQSNDMNTTLNMILNEDHKKVSDMKLNLNVYIGIIITGIITILVYIFLSFMP
jgi:hypothetical protein